MYKLIIFDADGTLRRCKDPKQVCPNKPDEWELIPGVKEKIAALDSTVFGIASNQAGVALGYLTEEAAQKMLWDLYVEAFGPDTAYHPSQVRLCPHNPKDDCDCRKPKLGMLLDIMSVYDEVTGKSLGKHEVLYVGDMESDKEAAERAGVGFMWAWEFFGWGKDSK